MVTAIYSIGYVVGAELWLVGYFICATIFLAGCLAFRQNRSKKGLITVLIGLLVSEILCDLIWFFTYFPGGEYRNYGIGAAGGLLLWPGLLFVAGIGIIVGAVNRREDSK